MVVMVRSIANTSPLKGWVASLANPLVSEQTQDKLLYIIGRVI
jgi:hypothetical protein